MSMRWGRAKRTGGPSIQPVYTHALVLLSFFGTLGSKAIRYERVWTPLERHYFPAYLGSQIAGVVRDNNWYTLLQVVARKGSRLALDSDVIPTVTESGKNSFALTEEALKHGALRLEPHRGYYKSAEMHAYLGNLIYQNQTLMDLVRPALWSGLVLFFAGLLPATYLDHKRSSALRYGKLTGPDLMNVAQFNRSHRFPRIGLVNEHRTMLDRMLGLNKKLYVPLGKNNPHVLVMAEPLPPEPPRIAAAVGTDSRSQASCARQISAAIAQTPSQYHKRKHAVTPRKRRFFE